MAGSFFLILARSAYLAGLHARAREEVDAEDIAAVSNAVLRARSVLQAPNRPIVSLVFLDTPALLV